MKQKQPRLSANGFYCGECQRFVYQGFTNDEKQGVIFGRPICVNCGTNHKDKEN
jgi:hypothetical protein